MPETIDNNTNQQTAQNATAAREPETFSREYVAELRAENKGWRLKAQEQSPIMCNLLTAKHYPHGCLIIKSQLLTKTNGLAILLP